MTTSIAIFVYFTILAILLLLGRKALLWYYHINERIENQEEMVKLLKLIAMKIGLEECGG